MSNTLLAVVGTTQWSPLTSKSDCHTIFTSVMSWSKGDISEPLSNQLLNRSQTALQRWLSLSEWTVVFSLALACYDQPVENLTGNGRNWPRMCSSFQLVKCLLQQVLPFCLLFDLIVFGYHSFQLCSLLLTNVHRTCFTNMLQLHAPLSDTKVQWKP